VSTYLIDRSVVTWPCWCVAVLPLTSAIDAMGMPPGTHGKDLRRAWRVACEYLQEICVILLRPFPSSLSSLSLHSLCNLLTLKLIIHSPLVTTSHLPVFTILKPYIQLTPTLHATMPWFPSLNLVPGFPEYSGPYTVGSCDVEFTVDELNPPSPRPDGVEIGTVSYRVFYPCEATTTTRPIRWLPSPQKVSDCIERIPIRANNRQGYLAAYAKFLGAHTMFAEAFSLVPQLLNYTTLPAHRNARLLPPTTDEKRWPTMIFSHGLGGSRNAYSHLCGSLASHGIIVIAPDHRDTSAPVSYIRATSTTPAKTVEYQRYSHTPSQEVYDGRDNQLRIRLWELGLIHDSLLKIDQGHAPTNLDPNSSDKKKKDTTDVVKMFVNQLDVHRPGSIIWSGHSFGAATAVQLLKSTYWHTIEPMKPGMTTLFTASPNSSLAKQITPNSPAILLDMWALPLRSPNTTSLWEQPMPCYASSGPGGSALLAILSEAFFKWSGNLKDMKRTLSPPPKDTRPAPRFFYPTASAHLSQSDFGILFPWVTGKALKATEPERYIKLNVRSCLAMLREIGYEVAATSQIDLEEEQHHSENQELKLSEKQKGDWRILDTKGEVRGWVSMDITPEQDESPDEEPENVMEDSRTPSDKTVLETEVLGEMKA
jgi:platelet-activating factor acetylhydrolase